MNRIVVATKNKGKVREIGTLLKDAPVTLVSLSEYAGVPDVVEDGETFLENAMKKARAISEFTGEIALADDSGLTVDFLEGRPGIYSSRYSGEDATDEKNIRKLLQDMKNAPREERGASFVCVLVLYFPDGSYESFEGRLQGVIYERAAGDGGFGYDPVFYLPDRGVTVAQLSADEKNAISHRGRALEKLKGYLQRRMPFLDTAAVRGDVI